MDIAECGVGGRKSGACGAQMRRRGLKRKGQEDAVGDGGAYSGRAQRKRGGRQGRMSQDYEGKGEPAGGEGC
jgi:hypothetical protein